MLIATSPTRPPSWSLYSQVFQAINLPINAINYMKCTWWGLWWIPGVFWALTRTDRGMEVRLPFFQTTFGELIAFSVNSLPFLSFILN